MSSLLRYKSYLGSADVDIDRGVCRGKLLFIDDLVTYEAADPKALVSEFEAAVDDYLETCETLKRAPNKPFSGQFNVRVEPGLHRAAAIRAAECGIALNTYVVRALERAVAESTSAPAFAFGLSAESHHVSQPILETTVAVQSFADPAAGQAILIAVAQPDLVQ